MESKKNPNIDYNKYRYLLLAFGLLASTFLVSMTFNIRSNYQPDSGNDIPLPFENYLPNIPIIEFDEPKRKDKPKPKVSTSITITELLIIPTKESPKVIPETIEGTEIMSPIFEPLPVEPFIKEFLVVEEQASFPGGSEAWMKYLMKNFKYPRVAKRTGIEGRVFLSFYVDVDGSLSNIEVLRGIGGGCDQEAIRVLKKSPKWNPGKQRGIAVKSPMTLFITFRLK